MNINLVHPSRGRPELAKRCSALWRSKMVKPDRAFEILSLDVDDPKKDEYHEFAEATLFHSNSGMVEATNRCLKQCQHGVTVTMYDDFEPQQGWDEHLVRLKRDYPNSCYFVSCGRLNVQTIQIADHNVFKRWGYILYPEYYSMYSDDDYTQHALTEGIVVNAIFAIEYKHKHPAMEGVPKHKWDETYRRSNNPKSYEQGKKVFEDRRSRSFQEVPSRSV